MRLNPGLMALITLGITDYVRFVVSVIRGNPFQTLFGRLKLLGALMGVMLVYGVIRNLPWPLFEGSPVNWRLASSFQFYLAWPSAWPFEWRSAKGVRPQVIPRAGRAEHRLRGGAECPADSRRDATPGPALVLAGAGAGKTRTLTYRVAYLLEQGIPVDRILLLTFTNKAARDDGARAGPDRRRHFRLWGGTFHSVGHRILRRNAEVIGYPPTFTIMDREDAKDLMSAAIADAGVDTKAMRFPKPDLLCDILSMSINTGMELPKVMEERYFILRV